MQRLINTNKNAFLPSYSAKVKKWPKTQRQSLLQAHKFVRSVELVSSSVGKSVHGVATDRIRSNFFLCF